MAREWQQLIVRYADGREICNCQQAYYTPCGTSSRMVDGEWVTRHDAPACAGGCSANQYNVRDEIAKRVLSDLEGKNGTA